MTKMAAISIDMVKLVGAMGVQQILGFSAHAVANEHAIMHFRGILSSESYEETTQRPLEGQEMYLLCLVNGEFESYFGGQLQNVSIINENGLIIVEADCISGSYYFDLCKISRSFQDAGMTYGEMLRKIQSDDEIGNIVALRGADEKIGYPIIQYQETDWEFIKRMASHFGTVVFPEITNGFPQISVGVVRGRTYAIDSEAEYETGKALGKYRWKAGRNSVSQDQFIYYRIKDYRNFALGDKLQFQGRTLIVMGKDIKLEKGLIEVWYVAGEEQGFGLHYQYNTYISGMSIIGTVLSTEKEVLKLHLDIDEVQDRGTAYEYSWKPQTGNMMYCMPTVGTRVSLYFPSSNEAEAFATECVRTNGDDLCPEMGDYNVRQFLTDHQKRLTMAPKSMRFVGDSEDNQNVLSLEDKAAISFLSDKPIKLSSTGQIKLVAKDNVYIKAKNQVAISKSGVRSGFDMSGGKINLYARKVYRSGVSSGFVWTPSAQPAPSFPFGIFAGTVAAAAPAVAAPAAPVRPANNMKADLMGQALSGLSSALSSVTATMAPAVDKMKKQSAPASSSVASAVGKVAALAAPLTMAKALLPPMASVAVGAAAAAVGVAAAAAKTASAAKAASKAQAASAPATAAKPLAPFSAAALTLPLLGMAGVGVGNMGGLSLAAVAAILAAASNFFGVATGSFLSIAKQTVAQIRESLLESVEPWKPSKKQVPNTGLLDPRVPESSNQKSDKKEVVKKEKEEEFVENVNLEELMWVVDGVTIKKKPVLEEQNKSNWCYAVTAYFMCKSFISKSAQKGIQDYIKNVEGIIEEKIKTAPYDYFYPGTLNDFSNHDQSSKKGLRGNYAGEAIYKDIKYRFCHPVQEYIVQAVNNGDYKCNALCSCIDAIQILTNKKADFYPYDSLIASWHVENNQNNEININLIETYFLDKMNNGPIIVNIAAKSSEDSKVDYNPSSCHSIVAINKNPVDKLTRLPNEDETVYKNRRKNSILNTKIEFIDTLDSVTNTNSKTIQEMFVNGMKLSSVTETTYVLCTVYFVD